MKNKSVRDEGPLDREFDFSKGRPNPYWLGVVDRARVRLIDKDLAAIFPDNESMNAALRTIADAAKRSRISQADPQQLQASRTVGDVDDGLRGDHADPRLGPQHRRCRPRRRATASASSAIPAAASLPGLDVDAGLTQPLTKLLGRVLADDVEISLSAAQAGLDGLGRRRHLGRKSAKGTGGSGLQQPF